VSDGINIPGSPVEGVWLDEVELEAQPQPEVVHGVFEDTGLTLGSIQRQADDAGLNVNVRDRADNARAWLALTGSSIPGALLAAKHEGEKQGGLLWSLGKAYRIGTLESRRNLLTYEWMTQGPDPGRDEEMGRLEREITGYAQYGEEAFQTLSSVGSTALEPTEEEGWRAAYEEMMAEATEANKPEPGFVGNLLTAASRSVAGMVFAGIEGGIWGATAWATAKTIGRAFTRAAIPTPARGGLAGTFAKVLRDPKTLFWLAYNAKSTRTWQKVMTGESYRRIVETVKDQDGHPVSDAVAIPLAMLSGWLSGMVQQGQANILVNSFPFVGRHIGGVAGEYIRKLISHGSSGPAIRAMQRFVLDASLEGGQEALQASIQAVSEVVAAGIAEEGQTSALMPPGVREDFSSPDLYDALVSALAAAMEGFLVSGVLLTPGALLNFKTQVEADEAVRLSRAAAQPEIVQEAVADQAADQLGAARALREAGDTAAAEGIEGEVRDASAEQFSALLDKLEAGAPPTASQVRVLEFLEAQVRGVVPEPEPTITPDEAVTPEGVEVAVRQGEYISDEVLEEFGDKEFAKQEIEGRLRISETATKAWGAGAVVTPEDFAELARRVDEASGALVRSDSYYREAWENAPRPEGAREQPGAVGADLDVGGMPIRVEDAARLNAAMEAEQPDRRLGEDLSEWVASGETEPEAPAADLDEAAAAGTKPRKPARGGGKRLISDILQEGVEEKRKGVTERAERLAEDAPRKPAGAARRPERGPGRLRGRLISNILRPGGIGLSSESQKELAGVQRQFVTTGTPLWRRKQEVFKKVKQERGDLGPSPEVERVINQKVLGDMSIKELAGLSEQIDGIREEGVKEKRKGVTERAERLAENADGLDTDADVGSMKEPKELRSKKAEKEAREGRRRGLIAGHLMNPSRLFTNMGTFFRKVLLDDRSKAQGQEYLMQKALGAKFAKVYTDNGLRPRDLAKRIPGTEYFYDDILFYAAQLRDPNGRQAVLHGNKESEQKLTEIINNLPPNYHAWLEGILDVFREAGDTIGETLATEGDGMGFWNLVRVYLPIQYKTNPSTGHGTRNGTIGLNFMSLLVEEAAIRADARGRYTNTPQFLKARKPVGATGLPEVRTDLTNLIAEFIQKMPHYVAMERWSRDMQHLFAGKNERSSKLRAAITQKWGQKPLEAIETFVTATMNPQVFLGTDMSSFASMVARNTQDVALMFKLSTVVVQLLGPFRYLGKIRMHQWHHLIGGLWKATLRPVETFRAMEDKSPEMARMAVGKPIDPTLQQGDRVRGKGMLPRSAFLTGVGTAREKMRDAGYAALVALNAWTISAGWTATYNAEMAKHSKPGQGEASPDQEADAIRVANQETVDTQPSGELADAPMMLVRAQKGLIPRMLFRFTRATNQLGQMAFVDLPRVLGITKGAGGIRGFKPDLALGIIAVIALETLLNGWRRRKRFPKDEEEFWEDMVVGSADLLSVVGGQVPGDVVGLFHAPWRGIGPLEDFTKGVERVAGIIRKGAPPSTAEIKGMLESFIGPLTGFPVPALRYLGETFWDVKDRKFQFEPWELMGGAPKE
jgi:hypothetical protein